MAYKELQVVSLSFLDLLCCAFGAVILLVVVMIPVGDNSESATQPLTLRAYARLPLEQNQCASELAVFVTIDDEKYSNPLALQSGYSPYHNDGLWLISWAEENDSSRRFLGIRVFQRGDLIVNPTVLVSIPPSGIDWMVFDPASREDIPGESLELKYSRQSN